MKALSCTLLLAALCFGLADSLQCYSCKEALNDREWVNSIKNCSADETRCSTVMGQVLTFILPDTPFVKVITKGCAMTCVQGNQNLVVANVTEGCCDTDLCNDRRIGDNNVYPFNSVASVKISIFLEVASILVVGALLGLGQ